MPTSPVGSVIKHIRRAVPSDGDGELLGRFVERRDERALAELVERHGPMVWGVCRRLLGHHDAEDAFQATFIVLVRKAGSVKPREMVGNWLYGVARQSALQARTNVRRRAREIQVSQMPDVEAPQDQWADVRPILDEELSRLPDHYRGVIVLCDLEGRTRKEVASQFGCPEGTVASRLVRARAMLAKRLAGRGVALSVGGLSAVFSQTIASAAVPASVVTSTIKAAGQHGRAALPVKVAALAEGVLKTMLLSKLKSVLGILVVAAMIGLVGYGVARGQKADVPQKHEQPKVEAVVKEKAEKKETIAWGKEVDGLQLGLAGVAGEYRQGEKMQARVRLRNVGKAEVKITHGLLKEYAPAVTDAKGGRMTVAMPPSPRYYVPPKDRVIKPGETVSLSDPVVAVESADVLRLKGLIRVDTPTTYLALGKYRIAFGGMIQSHPNLTTGTVEFEVKEQVAWGKEVDGVQIGIQFGEHRVYKVGETVTLIVRLRNNGKKDVPNIWDEEYFQKNPPLITDADGKAVKIKERNIFGILERSSVAPGKEVDLCRLALVLRPDTDRKNEESWTLYGTGKFHIQYQDVPVVGEPRLEAPVTTHSTGKLELEVKEAPPEKLKILTPEEAIKVAGDSRLAREFNAKQPPVEFKVEFVTKAILVKAVPKEGGSEWEKGHGPGDVALRAKTPADRKQARCLAILTANAISQLNKAGIKDIEKHFQGRTIRVRGAISWCAYDGLGTPPEVEVVVDDLSHLEVID